MNPNRIWTITWKDADGEEYTLRFEQDVEDQTCAGYLLRYLLRLGFWVHQD